MSKSGFILLSLGILFFSSCLTQPDTRNTDTIPSDSLHALVMSGNESKLNEIFKVDTNIDELDKNGRTPLHVACTYPPHTSYHSPVSMSIMAKVKPNHLRK